MPRFTSHVSRFTIFGPLAQLVEQLTLNQRVGGSTPPRPTIIFADAVMKYCFPESQRTLSYSFPLLSPDSVERAVAWIALYWLTLTANVAELVDALDLGSSGETRGSSSLSIRTNPSHRVLSG